MRRATGGAGARQDVRPREGRLEHQVVVCGQAVPRGPPRFEWHVAAETSRPGTALVSTIVSTTPCRVGALASTRLHVAVQHAIFPLAVREA